MKKLSFIQRNNQRHWVGDGFPVRSIFSYNDRAAEFSPFLLLDYAGLRHFHPRPNARALANIRTAVSRRLLSCTTAKSSIAIRQAAVALSVRVTCSG